MMLRAIPFLGNTDEEIGQILCESCNSARRANRINRPVTTMKGTSAKAGFCWRAYSSN